MPHFDPNSTKAHLTHGFKTGLATILSFVVANAIGLKFGYWAAISAVIVMQNNVADSMQMCWYRLTGTALGALIGVATILVFPETPVMTMTGVFLSVGFCAYMTRYDTRYRMAALTVSIVVLASLGETGRVTFGLFRVAEIALGVACAFLVSVLVFPQRAGAVLRARFAERFTACADLYMRIMNGFLSLQEHLDAEPLHRLREDILADREFLRKVQRHERHLYREDTELLELKMRTLEECGAHLQAMLDALNNLPGKGYEIVMESEMRELSEASAEIMRRIGAGRVPDGARLEAALDASEARLTKLREDGLTRRFYLQKLLQFFAFYHGAQFMGQDLWRYAGHPAVLREAR